MSARQKTGRSPSSHKPTQKQRQIKLPVQNIRIPDPQEALGLIKKLESLRGSKVITLVTSPDVTVRGDVIDQMYEQLRIVGHVTQLDLFLHSIGGQTEIPWRLITLIRDFCDRFAVLIPGIAHSAATHLAMGADEIIMGPRSELGPVDPARTHPLLPKQEDGTPMLVSVQDLRQCVDFIKMELSNNGPNVSSESMAQMFIALFDKVHPLAVGGIQQSYALARLISRKALSTHMDSEKDAATIDAIVDAFSDQFFSHHYRIAWREAKEAGLPVVLADEELWETMWALYKHYQVYFNLARDLGDENEKVMARPIVWIDSVCGRRILEEIWMPDAPSMPSWQEFPWETDNSVVVIDEENE